MRRKFHAALVAYAVLGLVGVSTLDEPRLRAAVLVLLAALAVKTWIGELQHRQAERERLNSEQE
jgi:uncharacterized membrane protein YfcA